MKLFVTLTALVGAAMAMDDSMKCTLKDESIVNAIGKFCQKKNMVVPSLYARSGMNGFTSKTHIKIFNSASGGCNPAQWVPQEYCFSQFYHMCANANNAKGTSSAYYGKNRCQTWLIDNGQ